MTAALYPITPSFEPPEQRIAPLSSEELAQYCRQYPGVALDQFSGSLPPDLRAECEQLAREGR
jgi:hypothetical protein